jgi:hypothetical protein
MATRKHDRAFRRRDFRITALFAVPMMICFGLAWVRPAFWPFALAFGGLGLAGLIWQQLRTRRYRCPECGARIPYRAGLPGAPIEYHCQQCDIIWDSGFVEPTPDHG